MALVAYHRRGLLRGAVGKPEVVVQVPRYASIGRDLVDIDIKGDVRVAFGAKRPEPGLFYDLPRRHRR